MEEQWVTLQGTAVTARAYTWPDMVLRSNVRIYVLIVNDLVNHVPARPLPEHRLVTLNEIVSAKNAREMLKHWDPRTALTSR